MSASGRTLDWLLNESASESGIARDALASALLEAARNADREQAAAAAAQPDARLEQLRRLLLGHEIATLSRLREQVDDPELFADAVSRALPSAVAQATARDGRLGHVLAPTVERAAQSSIRSNPRTLVNIIYPVIVPAIRKSIVETLDATLQALNASLAHSLSLRGLKWRLEAWRTGVPFAEVVLRHTLVFRVEHVFLIHRHTGLLIAQATAEDATSQDPQLVSSMLTAIQDFVRDSFTGTQDGALDTLRHGELLLWCEQGPSASLVAVIRGTPPESLHQVLRHTLSRIHDERDQALEEFDGDSAPFADVSAQLADCVQQRQLAPVAQRRRVPWLLVLVLLAALGFALDAWQRARHDDALWEAYLARLRAEPGIVVAGADKVDGGWRLSGLRDPLAADPDQLLQLSGIDPGRVSARWQPYQALNPSLVLQRLRASLAPPPTVTLAADGEAIVASGAASAAWLARARNVARSLPPGSPRIELAGVRDLNDGELGTLRVAIEAQSLNFDVNEVMPSRAQEPTLDSVAQSIRQMAELSARLGVVPRVTVTGHSDSTGKGSINLSVSVARAEVVRALLLKRGVNPEMVTVRGAGPLEPLTAEASEAERSMNRRVSFRVTLDE
ncbi:MAG: OmpA family protein [Burkholderiaceae bacterium]|nr:OmpA family protein [Burkholderiaceae bacterium]